MRLYVSSRSYPELREADSGLVGRTLLWLRAFGSATRDPIFLGFVGVQLALVLGGLALAGLIVQHLAAGPVSPRSMLLVPLVGIGLQLPAMVLTVTVGGDVIRPHLRAVCPTAREACPACGYGLREQFAAMEAAATATAAAAVAVAEAGNATEATEAAAAPGDLDPVVRCPECGSDVPLTVWRPPHRIPRPFRVARWP